jgi:hypothetical protein
MKRHASSPTAPFVPAQKKPRISADSDDPNPESVEWTKVERRKQKKVKKTEVKQEVCSLPLSPWSAIQLCPRSMTQAISES